MTAGPLTEETFPDKPPEETYEQFAEHSLGFASTAYDHNSAEVGKADCDARVTIEAASTPAPLAGDYRPNSRRSGPRSAH
ncbi:hypothetical protein J2792_002464 [Novosphingobium capsulatum]|uniref:Uncharacterized protein n=1 Tax=Novosphingobium capsulatum TaxID=13688 RepID=A0ABU1MNH7_9SPHN|nr:hypothetical protein [Novosphingobium capsulatum]